MNWNVESSDKGVKERMIANFQLHFVGIGGIGMGGLAEVFLNQGYRVSGSDLVESEMTRRMARLGVEITIGHFKENVKRAKVVVISSAIKPMNPEILEARRRRIPVIQRAEMLGELMRGKTGIAVAGTHGKTTTTSMLASVLTVAGLDPTLVIGGRVDSLGGGAKLGQGRCVVAEADESDGSFLHLPATYAIVTNIDNDHLDFFGNLSAIEGAFVNFVGKLPFYGVAAVCGEDPGVKKCIPRLSKPFLTYGFTKEWDVYADRIRSNGIGTEFEVFSRDHSSAPPSDSHGSLGTFSLHVPGRHNVLNSLAAIAVAIRLGLPVESIRQGLRSFSGVRRRMEIRWQSAQRRRAIVDDYGHHPTEISATLAAVKTFWTGRIITVFQPHRYSRTQLCKEGFLHAFRDSDIVFVTDIYPAGEDPIEGVTSEALARDIGRAALPSGRVAYVGNLISAEKAVLNEFSDGDLVLCLGAGSVTKIAENLVNWVIRKELS